MNHSNYSLFDLITLFLGGIFTGILGIFYLASKKKYVTREEIIELVEEIEQYTLEQVLETIELIESENENENKLLNTKHNDKRYN